MPIEDFEGNVPPIDGGHGYRPPGLPPAYKPPPIQVKPPSVAPSQPPAQMTQLPNNMMGYFMLLLGL